MTSLNGEVSGRNHVLVEVSPDIHICGFCKQQYNSFEIFLAHKQNGCHIPSSDISSSNNVPAVIDSSTEIVFEETYQACVMRGVKKILTNNSTQKTPSKHLKSAIPSKRRSCYFSGCSFKTQYGQKDMERHLKTHTGEKPFECELCQKRFSRRDKLSMHSRSHTGEKPHKCKYCAYAAADSSSLKKHLRIHYDERPFKCQICPYASRNSSQLTVHLRSHTGDAPFQCHLCEAKFKINSDLKRHIRIHSGEKPYKCDFCDYRCAMKGNLKSHVQIKHGTENTFLCSACDFQCTNKTALRQHSREHQPTQPIQCPHCSYSCSSKGALKIHERIHSDERPFKCDFCSFATKQRSNLVIHKKKFHLDKLDKGNGAKGSKGGGEDLPKPNNSRYRAKLDAARAFRCEVCEASFVREDSLRSHRKQHCKTQQAFLQLLPSLNSVTSTAQEDSGELQVPLSSEQMSSYSNGHLKILMSQESTFVQGTITVPQATALLNPTGQDLGVSPMIQQVNLLTPMQPVGPEAEGFLEQQTVLLTHISSGSTNPLHQALSAAMSSQDSSSTQTFITACPHLEGLNALIEEGGTEVTVVTEGNPSSSSSICPPTTGVSSSSQDLPKQTITIVHEATDSCEEGGLLVPNINIGTQGVVIQSLPLVISTQQQQPLLDPISLQKIYSDSHHLDGIKD